MSAESAAPDPAAAFETTGSEYLFDVLKRPTDLSSDQPSAPHQKAVQLLQRVYKGDWVTAIALSNPVVLFERCKQYRTAVLTREGEVVAAAVFAIVVSRDAQAMVVMHTAHTRNILGALLVTKLKSLAREKGHKVIFAQSGNYEPHISFYHKFGFSLFGPGPQPKTAVNLTCLSARSVDPSVHFDPLNLAVDDVFRSPRSLDFAALLSQESCDQELARWVALSSHEALTAARNAWCIEVATMVQAYQSAASGPRDGEASACKSQRL